MPLNRPALTLGPGPRAVHEARHWVVDLCRELGRPELAECAELGVSELATNALLHGAAPIQVRFRGTFEHPRVEVRDHSTERPVLPTPVPILDMDDEDDLLMTFGRGLSIVARSSDAWGADIEVDGKVVWFAPAAEFSEDDGAVGQVTGEPPEAAPQRTALADDVSVSYVGIPLRAYTLFERHLRELTREVRLLSLAHEQDYPLAKSLSDMFGGLERSLREIMGGPEMAAGRASGSQTFDLSVPVARSSLGPLTQVISVLDLADEFCREERLLALARTPEQREFQHWFLGEPVHQGRGEAPLAWRDAPTSRRSSVS